MLQLRQKYSKHRILFSKAKYFDAFRNVTVNPGFGQTFGYVWGDFGVFDSRVPFAWRRSPGYWGLFSAAAGCAHCRQNIVNEVVLDEGEMIMSHVPVTDRREVGEPTPAPAAAKIRSPNGGEQCGSRFVAANVDDYIEQRVQHDSVDFNALDGSISLACDHVRFFAIGLEEETPIVA